MELAPFSIILLIWTVSVFYFTRMCRLVGIIRLRSPHRNYEREYSIRSLVYGAVIACLACWAETSLAIDPCEFKVSETGGASLIVSMTHDDPLIFSGRAIPFSQPSYGAQELARVLKSNLVVVGGHNANQPWMQVGQELLATCEGKTAFYSICKGALDTRAGNFGPALTMSRASNLPGIGFIDKFTIGIDSENGKFLGVGTSDDCGKPTAFRAYNIDSNGNLGTRIKLKDFLKNFNPGQEVMVIAGKSQFIFDITPTGPQYVGRWIGNDFHESKGSVTSIGYDVERGGCRNVPREVPKARCGRISTMKGFMNSGMGALEMLPVAHLPMFRCNGSSSSTEGEIYANALFSLMDPNSLSIMINDNAGSTITSQCELSKMESWMNTCMQNKMLSSDPELARRQWVAYATMNGMDPDDTSSSPWYRPRPSTIPRFPRYW